MSIRSIGSPNPKEAGPQAVATHTAESGPPGPRLRGKYRHHSVKGTKSKTSGNSGKTGRRYRAYVRGHQGGQIPHEEKARREKQSGDAIRARATAS